VWLIRTPSIMPSSPVSIEHDKTRSASSRTYIPPSRLTSSVPVTGPRCSHTWRKKSAFYIIMIQLYCLLSFAGTNFDNVYPVPVTGTQSHGDLLPATNFLLQSWLTDTTNTKTYPNSIPNPNPKNVTKNFKK